MGAGAAKAATTSSESTRTLFMISLENWIKSSYGQLTIKSFASRGNQFYTARSSFPQLIRDNLISLDSAQLQVKKFVAAEAESFR